MNDGTPEDRLLDWSDEESVMYLHAPHPLTPKDRPRPKARARARV